MLRSMEFIEYGHNVGLVAVSFFVALVAGATGLTLTKDLSLQSVAQRKLSVAMAAIALGGGIWSMHFVAMLGLHMPILYFYDAAITLVSALIAILIVALALLMLHFTVRTKTTIVAAGALVGAGILAMHYVGMAGMQLCRPVYTTFGVISSSVLAIGLCIVAFGVAYSVRSTRNIMIGTLCFGVAVGGVHFLAMASTNFVAVPGTHEFGPLISNETMAIGVILSSFVLLGAFLWVGSTFLMPEQVAASPLTPPVDLDPSAHQPTPSPMKPAIVPQGEILRIHCEQDGRKILIPADEIAFVRADGHYTQVYTDQERFFCVMPITEATKRLTAVGFIKIHRSYVVNPDKVTRFERTKDKGRCSFEASGLPDVPVSRSHLKDAQLAFG